MKILLIIFGIILGLILLFMAGLTILSKQPAVKRIIGMMLMPSENWNRNIRSQVGFLLPRLSMTAAMKK